MGKLTQLKAFVAVVEENGFTAAAKKTHTTKGALSRLVKRLEEELNVELLLRTSKHIELTVAGLTYYQAVKKLLVEFTQAESLLTTSNQQAQGELNVVTNPFFAQWFILPKLNQFLSNNPLVKLHLQVAEKIPDFQKGEADILFGVSVQGPDYLVRRKVGSTRYVLCASPAYLSQHGKPETIADLTQHQYITHTIREPNNLIQFKNNQIIYLEPSLWINDSAFMRQAAIEGLGIVNLHDYMVKDAIEKNQLIEILPGTQEKSIPVFIYYQQKRYLEAKIRRFVDVYVESF